MFRNFFRKKDKKKDELKEESTISEEVISDTVEPSEEEEIENPSVKVDEDNKDKSIPQVKFLFKE